MLGGETAVERRGKRIDLTEPRMIAPGTRRHCGIRTWRHDDLSRTSSRTQRWRTKGAGRVSVVSDGDAPKGIEVLNKEASTEVVLRIWGSGVGLAVP